jgi:hypothetical protein
MSRRLTIAATFAIALLVMLGGPAASQAAPGNLSVLIDGNRADPALGLKLAALPGVANVDSFDSSVATPSAATLASYDLVVDTGDGSYVDPVLYGDRIANYLDAGGAVIQFAYDNWDHSGAHPTGRFESGGYAPFTPGPNPNTNVNLGTILVPGSPLLSGVPAFNTDLNTTDPLAPGATLLAKWSDGRNAIATKGNVVSVTAAPESGTLTPMTAAAQLALNAGNVLGRHTLTVSKTGAGSGTVSGPAGIDCGSSCAANFNNGSQVTLNATATTGSFAGWSGGGCSGTSSCTVTMSSATAVTATFDACVVPKVKGKKVKQAKQRLRNGDCRLGKVKNKGKGKIKKQSPKPGTVLPVDSTVNVTLG